MKKTITTLFFLLSLSISIRWATAAGWPTTGGNSQHNGQATVAGPSLPQILWTRPDPGFGVGSQVYVEGDRMVTRRERDSVAGVVVCYDLLSGEELWSRQFSSAGRAFPVGFHGGRIYAVDSAWNTVPAVPDPLQNYVNVAEKAALGGSNYGLVVKVQDSASEAYVESTEPDGERTFTARFWLDPSQLDIAPYAGNSIFNSLNIMKARIDVGGTHVFLFLSRAPRAANYRLEAVVSEEFGLSVAASIVLTSITTPVPAQVQLEWRAATSADAEDGLIRLTHLGTGESEARRDLDNHGYVIDSVQIGAFGNGQGSVTGSYFFDEYESFR